MEFEGMSNNLLKKLKQEENDREDRLSDLHDDLLLDILSFLPTKDAVATCVLSRRWSHVFKFLRRLEFVEYFSNTNPTDNIIAFLKFKGFIDDVLQKLCDSQIITSFELKYCKYEIDDPINGLHDIATGLEDDELKDMNINSWLYCLENHGGIKEVDISLDLNGRHRINNVTLGYFNYPTLEVLKLDGNFKIEVPIGLELVLPVLKELYLSLVTLDDEESICRLVSSCPLLQHLSLISLNGNGNGNGNGNYKNPINICAKNLRSLVICIDFFDEVPRSEFVLDVPKLETLTYEDTEASHYFVGEMNALVEVYLNVMAARPRTYSDQYSSNVPKFFSSLSNVRSLHILNPCLEVLLDYESVVLPVFGKLKYLELGCAEWGSTVSNRILLKLLNSAPLLETLNFPGIFTYDVIFIIYGERLDTREIELWKNTQTIPTCLSVSLKRIMMKKYIRNEWALQVVKYFPRSSSVLEQLIIVCDIPVTMEDKIELQTTLQNLPILSPNCSIIVD